METRNAASPPATIATPSQRHIPAMRTKDFLIVAYAILCSILAMNGPQPLLEVLRVHFGVTATAISLITAVTLLPLGFAPLVYGLVLEKIGSRTLLRWASLALAATALGIACTNSFATVLVLRGVQGFAIPAIFTALMTHVSRASEPARLPRSMAMYIATTIFSGFFGRFLSGAVATMAGWRAAFVLCSAMCLACAWLVGRLDTHTAEAELPNLGEVPRILRTPGFLRCYLVTFCAFFAFSGLLNYLPFRLAELWASTGLPGAGAELRTALMYSGFLMGIAASLSSGRVVRLLGSERNAVMGGLLVYLAAALLFNVADTMVVFGVMFVFCAGMFTVHSVLPGYLNRMAGQHSRGVVNGLYLSFYYAGGTLGSYLPGLAYTCSGWAAFTAVLASVLALALALAAGIPAPKPGE
jgi:YNFM family putative membrane transporter